MSKLKQPLLSLEAHGSIADTLTFQRRKRVDYAREKPRLPYFLTLPAQYQRWLYQDYAYLWRQQSAATRQTYATAGSRYHLTGFQYWMKYQLTNLPDIAGMWHLDEKAAATARDFSRNANHGVIVGPSPAVGVIDGAFSFDGINDRVRTPTSPSINMGTSDFSIEFFIQTEAVAGLIYNKHKLLAPVSGYSASLRADGKVRAYIRETADKWVESVVINDGDPHHIAVNYDRSANSQIFVDGVPGNTKDITAEAGSINNDNPLYFGCSRAITAFCEMVLDHFILRTRLLYFEEIERHSERRWPQ